MMNRATTSHTSLSQERYRTATGKFGSGLTIGKIIRDATLMEAHARYVIELDASGIVTKEYSNPPFGELVNCIVVLAPAIFRGQYVKKAVALEIGLGRLVPYKATEYTVTKPGNKKQVRVIQKRARIGRLLFTCVARLLPSLYKAIQSAVDETMEKWTHAKLIQEYVPGVKTAVYESWCTIRIPKDQYLLYGILRLKDEEDKILPGKNYAYTSERVHEEFVQFRKRSRLYGGEYPDDVVKESSSLHMIASWFIKNIKFGGYSSRSIDAVTKLLHLYDSHDEELLMQVLRVFKVPEAKKDNILEMCEQELGEQEMRQFVSTCVLRPCHVAKRDKKRTKHAANCFSIGIFGTRDHLIKLTERNISNRLGGVSRDTPHEEDADIPF